MNQKEIKDEIVRWNNMFPIDKWWRDKHKISFNSLAHRKSSFIDQYFEFREDEMYSELEKKDQYEPNVGNWFNVKYFSKEDSIERLIEEGRKEMKNFKMPE